MTFTKGAHQSTKFQTFDCSAEISPNLYFDRLLLLKVYKISAKKLQRSYVSWYWKKMQNLKKNRFIASKWQKFGEFSSGHSKISKICPFIVSLCANYITFDLKSTEEFSFMILRSHAKFEEKLICGLENDMRNSAYFPQKTSKCQNWYFHGILLSKTEM